MNKKIESVPTQTMEVLCRYRWPGNVRELENFIERSVILSRGSELQSPLTELQPTAVGAVLCRRWGRTDNTNTKTVYYG